MTSIALVRGSTETISRSISQRGSELVALDKLFSVAANVAKLSPAQIKLHSQTLASMLATTKAEIATLKTNKEKIDSDLGTVETPLSVGNNAIRARVHEETQSQLRELLPPITAAGQKAARLIEKIQVVQGKIAEDSVPTSSCCPSLGSLAPALKYAATAIASIAIYALYQSARG